MNKSEVKIGTTYRCKVTGKLADVRITGVSAHGGWDAVNVVTKRKVHIKSAQRLRGPAQHAPAAKRKKTCPPPAGRQVVSLAEYEAEAKAGPTDKASKKETSKGPPPKAAGRKRSSGLDAAAQVLADAGEPLNTKTMVERMLAKGLWNTNGKTPAATIYAAIIREIATKGSDARFRKVERGKFEAVK